MESQNKTSQAQLQAVKNWNSNNRELSNYIKYRSSAKTFINKKATIDDLKELQELINNRLKEI